LYYTLADIIIVEFYHSKREDHVISISMNSI